VLSSYRYEERQKREKSFCTLTQKPAKDKSALFFCPVLPLKAGWDGHVRAEAVTIRMMVAMI